MYENIEQPNAKDIMTERIYMVPSSATFEDLVSIMSDKRVSAVIVIDGKAGEKPRYYIITHTDIIDFLIKQKGCGDIYEVTLKEIMKGPIDIIDEDTSLDVLIRYMTDHGYKRVLVGKNGEPTGIVSTQDILAWNNQYFKLSKPAILMVMDNETSIILAKHIFKENFTKELNNELFEVYGGALSTISAITEELFNQSGQLRVLEKDNYVILFDPRKIITGMLICSHNSIELRRLLSIFMNRFEEKFKKMLYSVNFRSLGKSEVDISSLVDIFTPAKI
jgi:predicted transcriptional regulator